MQGVGSIATLNASEDSAFNVDVATRIRTQLMTTNALLTVVLAVTWRLLPSLTSRCLSLQAPSFRPSVPIQLLSQLMILASSLAQQLVVV